MDGGGRKAMNHRNRKIQFAIVLAVCISVIAQAVDLTVPPKGYSGIIDPNQTIIRRNDVYPLSDQDNNGKWRLLAADSDEFSGNMLDTNRWYPNNPKWKGRAPTFFHGANVSLKDGQLIIKINQHGDVTLPEGFTHTTGFIKSRKQYLYGYFEAELKCIDAPWVSCFWMCHVGGDWWTEIDICENCPGVAKNGHDLNSNVHVFKSPKEHGDVKEHFAVGKKYYLPFDLQADTHVWGLEWTPETIRFYFDGILFREQANTHWHQPLEVNINCESNKWFGALPDDSKLDEAFRVNYFRVWNKRQKDAPPH